MDNINYKLATILNDEEIIKQISRYEEELARKIGHEVVLIAYAKDK
jgi:hypothetical protein